MKKEEKIIKKAKEKKEKRKVKYITKKKLKKRFKNSQVISNIKEVGDDGLIYLKKDYVKRLSILII